ncbi:hypothetical protein J6590_009872 [Homalodisca vitripennis]|nr:hypothetical protein J6590_009872 [Homalodisca vitripennis]
MVAYEGMVATEISRRSGVRWGGGRRGQVERKPNVSPYRLVRRSKRKKSSSGKKQKSNKSDQTEQNGCGAETDRLGDLICELGRAVQLGGRMCPCYVPYNN